MRAVERLPAEFARYQSVGGVLEFGLFEAGADCAVAAIGSVLSPQASFDEARLRGLGSRRIGEAAFFGECFDPQSGALLHRGSVSTRGGLELHDPTLVELDRHRAVSSSQLGVEAGAGGQFAFAFAHPPYRLQATGREVQALFDAIRGVLLPPGQPSEILDWSSPLLPEVSDYFEDGMEWWGVFLFTIHLPGPGQLAVIAGSSTD